MKFYRIALLMFTAAVLTGCATQEKMPDDMGLAPAQPHSLYIVIQRNQRLPAEFLAVLQQESQKRLPNSHITVDENAVDDQSLIKADWIIALRATRIKPNYFNTPSDNSTVNGMTDCVVGAAVIGIFYNPIAPCIYQTDIDFLEANIRNVDGTTVKTYQAQQDGESWMWPVPFTAIKQLVNGDDQQQQIWLNLINTLYDKMLADKVFNGEPAALAKQE